MKIVLTAGRQAQRMQDAIFQHMSADQKLEFGAHLWLLGKSLEKEKYGAERPAETPHKHRLGA